MPLLRNVSNYKICLQNGSVVQKNGTIYVPSLETTEIGAAIAGGVLKVDTGCLEQKKVDKTPCDSVLDVDLSPKQEVVPGKKLATVNEYEVYTPNNEDEYEILDGVRVLKNNDGPSFDPAVFVDIE
jgi:hypothetical protein